MFSGHADVLEHAKSSQKLRVHFESGVTDDDLIDSTDEEVAATNHADATAQQHTSSSISGRIQRRKKPVRRPTAHVSARDSSEEKVKGDERPKAADSAEFSKNTKPSTLEQKLRDLSLKYRQQEHSPERQQPDPPEKTSVAAKNR